MSSTAKPGNNPSQKPERRRSPREYAKSLVYIELGDKNGGIALNFSEFGISVQAANAVSEDMLPAIRFQLPHSQLWIQTAGRVVWTSESQTLVAIEFIGLSEKSLEQIRQWLDYESKIDISHGLAPASSSLNVGPRAGPKVASALASMLSHDPHFNKIEEELLEQSEVSTYKEPVAPVPVKAPPAAPAEQSAPAAELHVEPATPAAPPPLKPPVEENIQLPPKHVIAERERTKFYEPPPRVFPGARVRRSSENPAPERRRELTPSVPIDPEAEQAQEEIRQIIASGEEERSRTILGRLQRSSTNRLPEKLQGPASAGSQSNPAVSSPATSKGFQRSRESALNRTAVRIELQKQERDPERDLVLTNPNSKNWTLPLLLGILVALLAALLWLGARGSIAALFGNPPNSSPVKTAASDPGSVTETKNLQIEIVDAKGRHRTIPAAPSPAARQFEKSPSQSQ